MSAAHAVARQPGGDRAAYRCECGHALQVFGRDRHRVFFEPANERLDDPVMSGVCPHCGRALPGKS